MLTDIEIFVTDKEKLIYLLNKYYTANINTSIKNGKLFSIIKKNKLLDEIFLKNFQTISNN